VCQKIFRTYEEKRQARIEEESNLLRWILKAKQEEEEALKEPREHTKYING
jgi:hypothetical protein